MQTNPPTCKFIPRGYFPPMRLRIEVDNILSWFYTARLYPQPKRKLSQPYIKHLELHS